MDCPRGSVHNITFWSRGESVCSPVLFGYNWCFTGVSWRVCVEICKISEDGQKLSKMKKTTIPRMSMKMVFCNLMFATSYLIVCLFSYVDLYSIIIYSVIWARTSEIKHSKCLGTNIRNLNTYLLLFDNKLFGVGIKFSLCCYASSLTPICWLFTLSNLRMSFKTSIRTLYLKSAMEVKTLSTNLISI